jgi:hypothetical protein
MTRKYVVFSVPKKIDMYFLDIPPFSAVDAPLSRRRRVAKFKRLPFLEPTALK